MQERGRARDFAVGLPAAAVAGLLLGVLGTFKHQVGVSAATGRGLPIGLVLVLLMTALFLAALRTTLPSRWFAAAGAVGAAVGTGILALPGPGGSRVVLLNYAGLIWLAAPVVLGVLAVAWPARGRGRPGRQGVDGILEPTAPSEDRTAK